jgi:hypothetical protein
VRTSEVWATLPTLMYSPGTWSGTKLFEKYAIFVQVLVYFFCRMYNNMVAAWSEQLSVWWRWVSNKLRNEVELRGGVQAEPLNHMTVSLFWMRTFVWKQITNTGIPIQANDILNTVFMSIITNGLNYGIFMSYPTNRTQSESEGVLMETVHRNGSLICKFLLDSRYRSKY